MAIIGMHALIYSRKAEAARQALGDAFGWRSVDAGRGWLIFTAPPTELAVHPIEDADVDESHELYLMCDDIAQTLAELSKKGVASVQPVTDQGYGLVTTVRLPSGDEIGLYEPRHPMAISRPKKAATRKPAKAARKAAARPRSTRSRRG